ncbi:MAG: DUF4270 domain-containing protein [Porphyromonadaceae bacterium]|nr:MAG: DUF4270 domain-containing protein [Porphyromonadaceae bacterium]
MINTFLRKAGIGLLSGSLVFLSFNGCTNSDEIGWNLTPPGDRFHYIVDSSAVISASTLRQDSVTTEKRTSSLLGCMNDPIFGRSTANLLAQLRLSSNDVDFGADPQIDSAMLLLKYQGYYGDTTALQSMRIFELTQNLFFDSTYYSNQNMTGFYDPAVTVGDFSYYPKPDQDSILIRLSDEFGNKLLNTDTANLSNNTAWLAFFKGLYFESQPVEQGGSIVYFDFTGGKSRLTLYYHNVANDSLKYDVVINSNSSWVNLFNHNFSGTPIANLINDSVDTHPEIYLQSMAGLRSHLKLEIPQAIMAKINDRITINKAELIITIPDDPTVSTFGRPTSLRVFNAGASGKNEFIDDLLLGEAYYGGTFNAKTSTYRFNIGRHLQNILHPDPDQRIANNGLFLVITNERTSGNRLILKNGTVNGGMKLVITYTPVQ